MHGRVREKSVQFQTSVSSSFEVIFVIEQIPHGFLCCTVLLAVWHFLLPNMQRFSPALPRRSQPSSKFHPSGPTVCWIFGSLPSNPPVSSKKCPVLRIWNLAVSDHSSGKISEIVFTRLSLSRHVEEFQWELECLKI